MHIAKLKSVWPSIFLLFVTASNATSKVETYQATEGACGDLVFVKQIAQDFPSALQEMKLQLIRQNKADLAIAPITIKARSAPTGLSFYGLNIINKKTGIQDRAMSSALSSSGKLFTIQWCKD